MVKATTPYSRRTLKVSRASELLELKQITRYEWPESIGFRKPEEIFPLD